MRITLRLIIPLAVGVALAGVLSAYYQAAGEHRSLKKEIEAEDRILAQSILEVVNPLIERGEITRLQREVETFGTQKGLAGVAVYNGQSKVVAISSNLGQSLMLRPHIVDQASAQGKALDEFVQINQTTFHIYVVPFRAGARFAGSLAVFRDASTLNTLGIMIWKSTLTHVAFEMVIIVGLTLLMVRWTLVTPIRRMSKWVHDLRLGESFAPPMLPEDEVLEPLARGVSRLAHSLTAARAVAEEEARLRDAGDSLWTAERLRQHAQRVLEDSRLFVVANREPYAHVRRGKDVEVVVPASGLVTALEPVVRACDGTWIAYGSGDADREMVDLNDRLRVPPSDPKYTLRRVWLTAEEQRGYYLGFSNEGLWPLCHIAHTRPVFRKEDWSYYEQVNRKFAEALFHEMEDCESPAVLVQDYHFALLPRLIKEERPDARGAVFWHIPWPNPQAFGICPWQRELLDGLLGADLVGFHIQAHCNHFMETVDSALEARVDWERFAVKRRGHATLVRPFPISVDFNGDGSPSGSGERQALLRELGVEAAYLGVGVDRIDYTKGIPERFLGVERFLEKYPAYRGLFTFVQLGSPSRTEIQRYQDLRSQVSLEATRINARFQAGAWKPIVLLEKHHTHQQIERFYRAAHVCLVTALHDGMNLVAKEFVAARSDEQGALLLSRFTGASRELRDALLVNPYDTEQIADAIFTGLEMDPEERRARMRRMRQTVKNHNVYRWSANLISELAEVRLEKLTMIKTYAM